MFLQSFFITTHSTAALYVVGTAAGEATVANNTDSKDSKYKPVSRIVILKKAILSAPGFSAL